MGGQENLKNYEHCATRLRIILKDNFKLDKEKAEDISESKGYFFSTGQHQFIFGIGKVNEVYAELAQIMADGRDLGDNRFKEDAYET